MTSTIKISKMTGKLENIPAINTNTLTNPFCKRMRKTDSVCAECYSANMLETFRASCVPSWESNGVILSDCILPACVLPKVNAAIFRFSAHGELINENHLINIMAICEKNPFTRFALWTKRTNLVQKVLELGYDIPDNLVMVFSNPQIDKIQIAPPENFDIVFNVISDKEDNRINCGSRKCIDCLVCYTNSVDCVVEALK